MTRNRIKLILALLLLTFLTAIVLEQAIPLYSVPDRDNGIYLYLGKTILDGKLPYVDAWEQKPPLIFYINALGLTIGNGSRWGVFALEFAAVFLAGWFFFRLAKSLWGFETAILSSVIWLLSLEPILQGGNFTEEYSLPLNFLSLGLFWLAEQKQKPVYYFWIGICFALSFFIRPNNAGVQFAIGLSLLLGWGLRGRSASPFKGAAWFSLGASLPALTILLYFLSRGILGEMIEVGFLYNFGYGSNLDVLGSLSNGSARLAVIWWLAFIGYFLWALRVWNAYQRDRSLPRPLDLAPLILLPLEIVLSGLSGRNYAHYFICWLPAMAFLSAYGIAEALRTVSSAGNRGAALLMILLVSFLFAVHPNTVPAYRRAMERLAFDRAQGIDQIAPVAEYIREHTDPSDTVLVWSSRPGINFMAQRISPTAYFGYPAYVHPNYMSKYEAIFLNDIMTDPPQLIVDSSLLEFRFLPSLDAVTREQQIRENKKKTLFQPDEIETFFQFVKTHYHIETQVDQYVIYRLNE